jgi:tetratricopeptide (TPR) repeat protein
LEKTVKIFEDLAKKNTKDHLPPYYGAKAHFAIADCLDIKSSEEFDQSGQGDTHIDAALALIDTSIGLKEDNAAAHALKFHLIRRKMLHVSFPGLMMYISSRKAAAERAIALAPKDLDCQYIAALQETEGKWPPPAPEESSAVFAKLLKQHPKMADAVYEMGATWEKAKKTDEARTHYKKALELDANHHWAKKKLKGLAGGKGA